MSDPREIVEEAKKEREEAQREMEKIKKGQETGKAAQDPTDDPGTVKAATKKPEQTEDTRQTETGFQSDIKDSSPVAEEIKKQESQVVKQQERENIKNKKKLEKQARSIIEREEEVVQDVLGGAQETRQEILAEAETAKLSGRNLEAGIKFSEAQAIQAGIAFTEGLTFPVRPKAIYQTGKGIVEFVVDPEKRAATISGAKQAIRRDPIGVLVSVPSAALGGRAFGYGVQKIGVKTGLIKPKFEGFTEKTVDVLPDEQAQAFTSSRLLPKGKYPKSGYLGFGREAPGGGGAFLLSETKTGITRTVYVPKLSISKLPIRVGTGIGALSQLKPVDTEIKTQLIQDTPKPQPAIRQPQITEPKDIIKQRTPQTPKIKPIPLPTPIPVEPSPIQTQQSKTTPVQQPVQRQTQEQAQRLRVLPKLAQGQKTSTPRISLPKTEQETETPKIMPLILGKTPRRYRINTPEELLGGPLKKRKRLKIL